MKVIFLNIWGGQVFEPLMQFIEEYAPSTDFFCFQEVLDSPTPGLTSWGGRTTIRKELQEALLEFQEYYAPSHNILDKDGKPDPNIFVGVSIFTKKRIEVKSQGRVHAQGDPSGKSHDDRQGAPHYFQYVRFEHNEKPYTLCNMHGTAHPGDKLDTPERLEQSKRITDFLAKEQGAKVLGGDFNLFPETESIKIMENAGMRNLIKEYKISTTRSELNYARYPDNIQYFSDYAFVSSEVQVTNFKVPQLNISDHLPLILEFS
ncbi:MAG: endonuclease/exonuclease/phosphatase family protein [Candidatus Wildermuthbacteria bacterium]|nr:endonuclease/exonuclease/phosphatase family protein [Candidatus Wildermuthbacteria bacterium]